MTPQERSDKLAKINETIAIIHSEHYGTIYYNKIFIGDCLDWLDSQEVQKIDGRHPAQRSLLILWKSKRLPIDGQSDECVSYIYSLIK